MTRATGNLPLIRLSAINPFIAELSRRGVDAVMLLRRLRLPDDVPASAELFISPHAMYEFVEQCANEADDPHLGFAVGRSLDLLQWDPIARAAKEAQSIGRLFALFIVHARQHSSATRYFLTTEAERATFGFKRVVRPDIVPAQNDAFYVGFLSRLVKRATGEHWDANQVLFEVADPAAIPTTTERLRVAVGDNSGARIRFPTAWLFEPFEPVALGETQSGLPALQAPRTLIESLHVALKPHLHEPDLNVEKAAEICGYKKRRLSTELRKKGTTLAKEIAALRARRAEKELIESDLRVSEIGLHVGFTDPTVFSRAFKNWTGQSPLEYRRAHSQTRFQE